MHAVGFEIFAAIGQLLGEHMLVDVMPFLAEQILGGGDQSVEMRLDIGFNRRRTRQHGGGGMHITVTVRLLHLRGHVAHVSALVGVRRERHMLAEAFQIAQPG